MRDPTPDDGQVYPTLRLRRRDFEAAHCNEYVGLKSVPSERATLEQPRPFNRTREMARPHFAPTPIRQDLAETYSKSVEAVACGSLYVWQNVLAWDLLADSRTRKLCPCIAQTRSQKDKNHIACPDTRYSGLLPPSLERLGTKAPLKGCLMAFSEHSSA